MHVLQKNENHWQNELLLIKSSEIIKSWCDFLQ